MNTRWILVILLTVMMIAIIWRNEMSDMAILPGQNARNRFWFKP